ncbi:HPP family protein [Corallincola platygyrae]|uniref:HPP family protein n=1 Tax=Corallincola platygyrae TaxID=1193278 RepID=A0ABW4XQ49_9GAMM
MFYIYSPQGRIFSGTLEKLRKVDRGASSQRTGVREEYFLQQEIEASANFADPLEQQQHEKITGDDAPYQASPTQLQAYQKVLEDQGQREPVYHAYQAMSRKVVSVTPNFTLAELIGVFNRHNYKLLPILDEGKLVAAISRQHLYQMLVSDPSVSRETTLAELLAQRPQQVLSIDPVSDIRRAAKVMLSEQIEALPVVNDQGVMLGILSRTDILNCVIKDPPLSLWT